MNRATDLDAIDTSRDFSGTITELRLSLTKDKKPKIGFYD